MSNTFVKALVEDNKGNYGQSSGLSKTQIALCIGVPVAAICLGGAAYYYLSSEDKDGDDGQANSKANVEPAEEKDPLKRAEAFKLRGNKYFKGREYKQAINCYTDAISTCPSDNTEQLATFYQNRAAAHEQLKNWEEVVADCSKAIQYNKKYSKALSRRARAHESLKMMRECLQDATAVCLLEGFQNRDCITQADRALKELGKMSAAEHFKNRQPILPSGTFIKSYLDSFHEDVFSHDFSDDDKDSSPYCKAVEAMKAGQFEDVISLCTSEIEEDKKYSNSALLLRATMYTLMSSIAAAMDDFEKILALEETDDNKKLIVNALIKRGSLLMQETKEEKCFADFERAEKLRPDDADIFHHRGQIYFLVEKLDQAREDFAKAIQLAPAFVHPRLQVAYCTCRLAMQMGMPGMLQEANKILEEVCRDHPEAAEAWSLYGQLLQDQQKFDEADEKIDKALALQPLNPTNYVYKALLELQSKQDLDAAQKLIEKSIEVDDKCDFAYETLATLHVQRGNLDKAVEYFQKAINLVRTEAEMAHTYSLLEAAKAQGIVTNNLGIKLPQNVM